MKHPFPSLLKYVLILLLGIKVVAFCFVLSNDTGLSDLLQFSQVALAQDEKKDAPPTTAKQKDTKTEKNPNPAAGKQAAAPQQTAESPAVAETKIILESLEKKRKDLKKEEERIAEERSQLEKLKEEMAQKVVSLNQIHQQIEEKLTRIEKKETEKEKQQRQAKERKIKQLLKIYTNMKPKDVGSIVDKLDFEDALTIFLRMKGNQAAKILTFVNQERAVKISEELIRAKKKAGP